MRLIDADDFGNRMYHEVFEKDTDMQKWDSGCWMRYKLFENILKEQPTIEPERKRGEWIIRNTIFCGMCECTVCGASRPYTVYPMYYCQNCGAKMEGPEDIPMEYFESGGKVNINE